MDDCGEGHGEIIIRDAVDRDRGKHSHRKTSELRSTRGKRGKQAHLTRRVCQADGQFQRKKARTVA